MQTHLFRSIIVAISIFTAAEVMAQYAVPADGKDFYLGFVYPSYNKVGNASTDGFFGAYALISSYSDNHVQVSYYDKATGYETPAGRYLVLARTAIQVPLNIPSMRMNDTGDVAEYGACHITAEHPINVEYFSTGACSGGSYLAIATQCLGRRYVVASYTDNPGDGGLLGQELGPKELELSHGFFEIVAAFDSTKVTIIPNTTTLRGHVGASSGVGTSFTPTPYTIDLMRGECYLVKSGGDEESTDITGSVIESTMPIAVLAGHENAFLGGLSGQNLEGRDFMIEEMIPADVWDTTGYVSIPLADSAPADSSKYQGVGENYRTYTWDSLGSAIKMFDACSTGSVNMSAGRLVPRATERQGVVCPVEFKATNGKKFGVMMYDQRNFAQSSPYPAPSMMTIVPISHWRSSYLWYVPTNKFESLQAYYVNVIGLTPDFDAGNNGIVGSYNGGKIKPIKSLMSVSKQWNTIPNHPELEGLQFKLQPGSYYATGPHPFMVYNFGFRGLDPNFDLGDFDGDDFFFSYAAPAGMQFGGGTPNFQIAVDTLCTSWKICIHDSTFGQPHHGIKSITLLNDSAQDFVKTYPNPPKAYYNVFFNDSLDLNSIDEIDLSGNDSDRCVSVAVHNPLRSAYAPVFIADDQGNATILDLFYAPPRLSLHPDSGNFLSVPVGRDTCQKFVFKNIGTTVTTADTTITYNSFAKTYDTTIAIHTKLVGPTFEFTSANLVHPEPSFSITSIVPNLPAALKPGDSVVINACFHSADTSAHSATLLLANDCYSIPISLLGKASVGLIVGGNRDFGNVIIDSTKCDTVTVRNVGNSPFTLTKNWMMVGSSAFVFTDSSLLPVVIGPGQYKSFTFCFTPKGDDVETAVIHWNTDIYGPFRTSIKDSSRLQGAGVMTGFVWDRLTQDMVVDSSFAIDHVTRRFSLFNNDFRNSGPSAHVDSVFISGPDASEFQISANQLGFTPMGNFDLKPGDTIWVDVTFTPDITKPLGIRYANRHAALVAAHRSTENDQVVQLTGIVGSVNSVGEQSDSKVVIAPNPAQGNFVMVSLANPSGPNASVVIYDVLGRSVYSRNIQASVIEIGVPIERLSNGTYYVHINSGSSITTQKFEIAR